MVKLREFNIPTYGVRVILITKRIRKNIMEIAASSNNASTVVGADSLKIRRRKFCSVPL
jgi:hypothetical protein